MTDKPQAELPTVTERDQDIRSVYDREQNIFEDLTVTHHKIVGLPRELQKPGRILTAAEAIPKKPRLRPLFSLAMAEEHEGFHSSQGVCFPFRCCHCYDQDKRRRKREQEEFEASRHQREAEERRLLADDRYIVHRDKHVRGNYMARSCTYCKKMDGYERKYAGKPDKTLLTISRGEKPKSEGGTSTVLNLDDARQVYVGMWSFRERPWVRWCGYKLVNGETAAGPKPEGMTPEAEARLTEAVLEHFQRARKPIVLAGVTSSLET